MKRTLILLSLACMAATSPAHAQTAGAASAGAASTRYISDEINVAIREAPRNDAGTLGIVKSGARVTLLETLGPESFARIRTADGRTGWVTARFITSQPAAATRLAEARAELDTTRQQLRAAQAELTAARAQLEQARPAFELSQENERLKAAATQHSHEMAELQLRYDAARQQRKTLMAGAGLMGGGVILGLLLPVLLRGRRRRYNEF